MSVIAGGCSDSASLAGESSQGKFASTSLRELESGYLLVAGERRWRAAGICGLKTLPCRVLEDIDDIEAFILSTTENVVRRDMTLIEEAKAYARIAALGRTKAEIAALFGKSEELVGYRMDLLRLREDLQHLVARGQIKPGLAWYLARLSLDGQAEVVKRMQAGEFANDDAAQRYANAVYLRESQPALFAPPDPVQLAERRRRKQQLTDAWEEIARAARALAVFTEPADEALAATLADETGLYQAKIDALARQVNGLRAKLSRCLALVAAGAAADGSTEVLR